MFLVRSYRMAAAALSLAVIASACSSGASSVPSPSSSGAASNGQLTTHAVAQKSATVTYKAFAVVAAPSGAQYGIKQWAFYGWSDNKTTSAIGLSASGAIVWEADVVNDTSGNAQSVTTNLGTLIARTTPTAQTVTVYKKNATDTGIAVALRTDMEGYAGYGGSGGRPGGPQPTSVARSTSSSASVTLAAANFSLDLAEVIVTVGEVGTLAAVGPIGWLALGADAATMLYEMYQANEENQAPVGASPGGLGPTPGPSSGGGGSGTVTRVCAGDEFGNLTCWYTFY
jgi:hypothetical protein